MADGYRFLSFGDAMLLTPRRSEHEAPPVDVEAHRRRGPRRHGPNGEGIVPHPVFMPVGTRGAIRGMSTHELASMRAADGSRAEILLANTYHLMLRPGAGRGRGRSAGCTAFSGWDGHHADRLRRLPGVLARRRRSPTRAHGSARPTTATPPPHPREGAVAIQEQLGADIQMVLDVCAPLPSDRAVLRARSTEPPPGRRGRRAAHRRREDQALFGIVQGGDDVGPAHGIGGADRRRSTSTATRIGGLSVGETRERDAARAGRRARRVCRPTSRGT